MNAKDTGACFCSKAELELFTTPPINVSMERGDFAVHRTLATITETSPLEFFVPGGPEEYIDLGRTRLRLNFQFYSKSKKTKDLRGRSYYLARIIPMRGSWVLAHSYSG